MPYASEGAPATNATARVMQSGPMGTPLQIRNTYSEARHSILLLCLTKLFLLLIN